MEKYIYLDHTSEAQFQAFGKTLEEAFSNVAYAVYNLVVKTEDVKSVETKEIKVQGTSPLRLLFNFIDELVYIQDEGFMLSAVKELSLNDLTLTATLTGDDHKYYETHGEVKAPTFNAMSIELDEKRNIYIIQCVVDV